MSALSAEAVRQAVRREWDRFLALATSSAAGDDGGSWRRPTRLAGWTVADLAVHAVWGVSMEADALRRARTGDAGAAEGRMLQASTEPNVVLDALHEAERSLLDELALVSDADGERPVPMPYGIVPLAGVLPIFVMEAGVHANDLAAAVGADEELAPDVRAATAPVLRIFLPALAAAASERPREGTTVSLDGPTVSLRFRFADGRWTADDDAPATSAVTADDDSTILLYALGRIEPDDRRLNATDRTVLEAFKRWCPGL